MSDFRVSGAGGLYLAGPKTRFCICVVIPVGPALWEWREGLLVSGADTFVRRRTQQHLKKKIFLFFAFPLLGLAGCLQLAKREKSQWEQSRQEQSKRGRFRDGGAAAASSSTGAAASSATSAADATQSTAAAFSQKVSAADRDGVVVQRNRAISRQDSAAIIRSTIVHCDAGQRDDIPLEVRGCADRRRTAHLPEQAVIRAGIDDRNNGIGSRCERAADLEYPRRVRQPLGVECEGSRQLRAGSKKIHAGHERKSSEVRSGESFRDALARQGVVRGGEIRLSL